MDRKAVWLLALSSVLLLGGTASAITVDGDPTDWLGSAAAGYPGDPAGQLAAIDALSTPGSPLNNTTFTPELVFSDPLSIPDTYIEDGPSYVVGPGVGGQDFDVEAMYANYVNFGVNSYASGDGLYVGIFTGFDPEGEGAGLGDWDPLGQQQYSPGDLFFDFGNDGTWDLAIEAWSSDPSGTVGHAYRPTGSGDWFTPTPYPSQSKPGEIDYSVGLEDLTLAYAGSVDPQFAYSDRDASDHNFIEAYLDENFLIWGSVNYGWDLQLEEVAIHWTQSCGNDVGDVTPTLPDVPEPATMAMLGCLGVGMFVARKVRSKKS